MLNKSLPLSMTLPKFYNGGLHGESEHETVKSVDRLTLDFFGKTPKENVYTTIFKDRVEIHKDNNVIVLRAEMANQIAEFILNAKIPKP